MFEGNVWKTSTRLHRLELSAVLQKKSVRLVFYVLLLMFHSLARFDFWKKK